MECLSKICESRWNIIFSKILEKRLDKDIDSGKLLLFLNHPEQIPSFKVALAREERIGVNIGDDSLMKKQEILSYLADLLTFKLLIIFIISVSETGSKKMEEEMRCVWNNFTPVICDQEVYWQF